MTAVENDIFWVISNYRQDPSAVIEALCGEYQISNQSKSDCIPPEFINDGRLVDTLHSGHNLSDYLQYIIENYDRLPCRIGFVKGNLFPRHISKEIFLERKKCSGFVSLYGDEKIFLRNINFTYHFFILGNKSPRILSRDSE